MSKKPEYIEFSLENKSDPKASRRLRFPKNLSLFKLLENDNEFKEGPRQKQIQRGAKKYGFSRIDALSMSDEEVSEFVKEKDAERMKQLAVNHAVNFLKDAIKEGLVKDSQDLRDTVTLVMANLAETLYKKEGNVSDLESYAYTVHPFLKEHIEQVIYLATHDMLTGALNKFGLEWYISEELDTIEAGLGIDLTNFKVINDTFGHKRGDEVLKDTKEIIEKALREDDVVARIGGDEFFAVLCDKTKYKKSENQLEHRQKGDEMSEIEKANSAKQRIAQKLNEYLRLEKNAELRETGFDIAVGAVIWRKGVSTEVLMSEADEDMYRHKKEQRLVNGSYR